MQGHEKIVQKSATMHRGKKSMNRVAQRKTGLVVSLRPTTRARGAQRRRPDAAGAPPRLAAAAPRLAADLGPGGGDGVGGAAASSSAAASPPAGAFLAAPPSPVLAACSCSAGFHTRLL